MKKFFLFSLMILFVSCSKKNELRDYSKYDLKIYYMCVGEDKIKIYDNESEFYNKKFISNIQNAPLYWWPSGFKKNEVLGEGYYLIQIFDENQNEYLYEASFEHFIYDDKTGKAYYYDFVYDLYKYFSYNYLTENYVPKERLDYVKSILYMN